MTTPYLSAMELLIKDGLYENKSEIIKDALRRLFRHYEITMINDSDLNQLATGDVAV